MKTRYIPVLLLAILACCRQQEVQKRTDYEPLPVKRTTEKPSQQQRDLEKIALFLDVLPSDSIPLRSQLRCWGIDKEGRTHPMEIDQGIAIYKKFMISGQNALDPMFGTTNGDLVMLILANKGFGGNIRGLFLIDRATLEVKKVNFEHKAESPGYGAAIVLSPFEDQFVGAKIQLTKNTFGLRQSGKLLIEGATSIDGISGATITSRLTVEMINDGLKRYRSYLSGN